MKRIDGTHRSNHPLSIPAVRLVLAAAICLLSFSGTVRASTPGELEVARGIERLNAGDAAGALALLETALGLQPGNSEALYYAGVARARLRQPNEAEKLLLQARETDPSSPAVAVELAQLYADTGRCDLAEQEAARYVELTGSDEDRSRAGQITGGCRRETGVRPWRLALGLAWQYDSNVILEPSNPPPNNGRAGDWRGIGTLAAGATLLRAGPVRFDLGYDLYLSRHHELSDFDVQYHRLRPLLTLNLGRLFQFGAEYGLEYTRFGGDGYSRTHGAQGSLRMREGSVGATDLVAVWKSNTYWNTELFPNNELRSGTETSFGLRQHLGAGMVAVNFYGTADADRTDAPHWDYDGYTLGGGLALRLAQTLRLSLAAEYGRREYLGEYPASGVERLDETRYYVAGLSWKPGRLVTVSLTQSVIDNGSNLPAFDYDRSITGLVVTVGIE